MFKKLGATGLNGLMAVLLLGLLALPFTSIGLAGVKTRVPSSEVLSAQDSQDMQSTECVCPELVITPEMEREIFERLLREEEEEEKENETTAETEEMENGGVVILENSL